MTSFDSSTGAKFAPQGTPLQQRQRLQQIEKQLEREARRTHRDAERLDRLRAKVEAVRTGVKPLSAFLLCEVVNHGHGAGTSYVAKLAGVERYADHLDFVGQIMGHVPKRRFIRDLSKIEAVGEALLPKADALSQAAAVVNSVLCASIDWSAEPSTHRERLVRAAYLQQQLDERFSFQISNLCFKLSLDDKTPASDLKAAVDEHHRRLDARLADQERKRLQDAVAAVDRADEAF